MVGLMEREMEMGGGGRGVVLFRFIECEQGLLTMMIEQRLR